MYQQKYRSSNYHTAPRPTEFLWATNLANLLIDCVDSSADLWKEFALHGNVNPPVFEVFIQNFRSLVHHTSEYIHNDHRSVVKNAEELFESNLNFKNGFSAGTVKKALKVFDAYNKRIHHTPALMKIIEELNIIVDSGD